jgi:hypothetical protein
MTPFPYDGRNTSLGVGVSYSKTRTVYVSRVNRTNTTSGTSTILSTDPSSSASKKSAGSLSADVPRQGLIAVVGGLVVVLIIVVQI